MKIYFVFGVSILLFFAAQANAGESPPWAAIQATATVSQPVGLVEAQQVGDARAFPVVAECSSRWFLYLPRQSNMLVQLDGRVLETTAEGIEGIVTVLDLTEISVQAADSITLTLIYSEN